MARLIRPDEARDLGLPGRKSLEIVSADKGARAMTLRLVEIPVPGPGDEPRGRHRHDACEECIYVLSGRGTVVADSGDYPVEAGDTILIPPGEGHVTRNTGAAPLKLLCFFPNAKM